MIDLDTGMKTWGKVSAICWISGERFYFMDENGSISMIPASVVENDGK